MDLHSALSSAFQLLPLALGLCACDSSGCLAQTAQVPLTSKTLNQAHRKKNKILIQIYPSQMLLLPQVTLNLQKKAFERKLELMKAAHGSLASLIWRRKV